MKDRFKNIIYEWVEKNFGESEAEDPSWDIDALASELESKFHSLYRDQEMEYLKEDVESYAVNNGIKLTRQQIYDVANRVWNSEQYVSVDLDLIDFLIKDELERSNV